MTTTSYSAAREAEAAVEQLRAEFAAALRTSTLPDPVRVYLHVLAEAATATNGRGHLIKPPTVPDGVEAATGLSADLFDRVHGIAVATGWLRADDAVRYQVLLVDVPRWTAKMMDLGLYDDPDDPEWHGRPVEPYSDVETYKARIGALALA